MQVHETIPETARAEMVIVTGFSGAGKTVVLRALEDIGFFCIDNLPSALFSSFFQVMQKHIQERQKIALGIDVRSGEDMRLIAQEISQWKQEHRWPIRVFFVSAMKPVLIKRFQETRRTHPLARTGNLSEALEIEAHVLEPLREIADTIINTDQMTIHQLRQFIAAAAVTEKQLSVIVNLMSFGFKYGIPPESSFIYDMRCLPNPYFVEALKTLDGRDEKIKEYLFAQQVVQDYWERLRDFILFTLQGIREERRFFVNIAIGCTGGRHRSVALVEKLAQLSVEGIEFYVKHRDLHRDIS